MQKITSTLTFAIIGALIIAEISMSALGTNSSFTLQPLEERIIALSLRLDDGVSGSFSTVSDDGTGVNFHVTDPYNNTILQYEDVIQRSFSFTAETEGDFQLHFDNSLSAAYRKTVSLNYDVTHYIMGLPQEQFLMIVIVAVAVIGLMLYAALMPK